MQRASQKGLRLLASAGRASWLAESSGLAFPGGALSSAPRAAVAAAAAQLQPAATPAAARAFHSSPAAADRDDYGAPLSPWMRRSTPANTILRIVPQQTAYVVERFGKYSRTLT